MAKINPFKGIRPKEGLESRIAALPYDVYNREEAKEEVAREPLSFLKIDRAEVSFPDDVDTYDDRVYKGAHDLLWKLINKGYFIQEKNHCYYIYELTMNGRTQTGIVACASIDDYENQIIKKHENTRADKEEDRIRHVDTCDAQTGPIFLAYRSREVINQVVNNVKKGKPVYDFKSVDGIQHHVWIVDRVNYIETIRKEFANIKEIYIADGHHRCASAVKVGLKRRSEHPDYNGSEEFNYFLSVLFPDDELMIMDYNRVVKDLNGYDTKSFLDKIEEKFNVTISNQPVHPKEKCEFGMYLDHQWYSLKAKDEIRNTDAVDGLDVSILQNNLLEPILGIQNPKTDKRIDFVGGIRGLEELERRVHADCKVAFSMYPTSISELFAVADENRLMPPKSTWFEPKLRSGLFIHSIKETH